MCRAEITSSSNLPAGRLRSLRVSQDKLGTQMRAVGEVMSIGKTYKEAFQKAIRSLEIGRYGLGNAKNFGSHEQGRAALPPGSSLKRAAIYPV